MRGAGAGLENAVYLSDIKSLYVNDISRYSHHPYSFFSGALRFASSKGIPARRISHCDKDARGSYARDRIKQSLLGESALATSSVISADSPGV